MGRDKKKILTPDQFELNEKGEVVIKDADIVKQIEEAKATGQSAGEQGGIEVSVAVSVD